MSAQFTDSFFSITRKCTQIATGEPCSAVPADDIIRCYRNSFARIPHWIRVLSLTGKHLELDIMGKRRSASAGSVVVARRNDAKVIIISMSDFEDEFSFAKSRGLFDRTDNEGEQQ